MQLICPTCKGPLTAKDESTLVCESNAAHTFLLLFLKPKPKPKPEAPVPGLRPMGQPRPGSAAAQVAAWTPSRQRPPQVQPATVSTKLSVPCVKHRNVSAERYCSMCEVPMCDTCTFELPNSMMICPDCAMNPPVQPASKQRVTLAVVGMVLAVFNFIFFFVAAAIASGSEAAGIIMTGVFVLIEVGLAVSMCAMDKRAGNRWWVWVAVGANGLNVTMFVLATVVGLMSGG